jgi:hypothetical protein
VRKIYDEGKRYYFTVQPAKRHCSWLRHCATSRIVAGSIPDEVIGFFNRLNPCSRPLALGST